MNPIFQGEARLPSLKSLLSKRKRELQNSYVLPATNAASSDNVTTKKLMETKIPPSAHPFKDLESRKIRHLLNMSFQSQQQSANNSDHMDTDAFETSKAYPSLASAADLANKAAWSTQDDIKLRSLVMRYGPKRWRFISTHFENRSTKQCRDRWHSQLRPDIKREPWTYEEDCILINAQIKLGNKWAKIAKIYLNGRTTIGLKNRFVCLQRNPKRVQAMVNSFQ